MLVLLLLGVLLPGQQFVLVFGGSRLSLWHVLCAAGTSVSYVGGVVHTPVHPMLLAEQPWQGCGLKHTCLASSCPALRLTPLSVQLRRLRPVTCIPPKGWIRMPQGHPATGPFPSAAANAGTAVQQHQLDLELSRGARVRAPKQWGRVLGPLVVSPSHALWVVACLASAAVCPGQTLSDTFRPDSCHGLLYRRRCSATKFPGSFWVVKSLLQRLELARIVLCMISHQRGDTHIRWRLRFMHHCYAMMAYRVMH
jgi:hypothetical protein